MTAFEASKATHVHCFQHVSFESPAYISDWLKSHAYTIGYPQFYESNFIIPALQEIDALLIMGEG